MTPTVSMRLIATTTCLLLAATSLRAQDTSRRGLLYSYPDAELLICDFPPSAAHATDPPDCQDYRTSTRFFNVGDVARLKITGYPLLSTFTVTVDSTRKVDPVRPYIYGISNAAPAAGGGTSADTAGKGSAPMTLNGELAKDRPMIRKGDTAAFYKAFDAIRADEARLFSRVERSVLLAQSSEGLRQLVTRTGPPHGSYPGPTWDDVQLYAASLLQDWRDHTSQQTLVRTGLFQALVKRTQLLVDTVKDLNGRIDQASAGVSLADLRLGYAALVYNASTLLEDARQADSELGQLAEKVLHDASAAPGATASTAPSKDVAQLLVRQNVSVRPAPFAAEGDTKEQLRYLVDLLNRTSPTLALLEQASAVPDSINATMAEIFAHGNAIYTTCATLEPQVIMLGQLNASQTAQIQIQETKGFQLFAFASIPDRAGAAASDSTLGSSASTTSTSDTTAVSVADTGGPNPTPDPPSATASGDAKATKTKAAGGKGDSTGTAGASADPSKTIHNSVGVDVHQVARANFVSGFVRSWIPAREFSLKEVPAVDASGAPVLDEKGKQTNAKTPVETKNQRGQYVYYVGLNFYTKPRDLFPHALHRSDYFYPGVMIGYGVSDQLNFLVGLNWETAWGLNFGGGLHLGNETVLKKGFDAPGFQLPDSETNAPTTTRLRQAFYFNIGFDASVLAKVLGAAKKPGT
jgi:hypothetical protein